MDPSYRPSLVQKSSSGSVALPFAGSDLVLSPSQWSRHVVGMRLCECGFYRLAVICSLHICIMGFFFEFSFLILFVSGFQFIQERLARGLTWIQKTKFFGLILKLLWSKRFHGPLISPCRCASGSIFITLQIHFFFLMVFYFVGHNMFK